MVYVYIFGPAFRATLKGYDATIKNSVKEDLLGTKDILRNRGFNKKFKIHEKFPNSI